MRRTGFTLVELMIVIGIMGILATVGIPSFQENVLKSRRAEAKLVMSGIGAAEAGYNASHNGWVVGASNPGTSLGKAARAWNPTMTGWNVLGFRPDGLVRCNYIVTTFDGGEWARGDVFCDLDDDNQSYILRYYMPSSSPNQSYEGWREVNGTRY